MNKEDIEEIVRRAQDDRVFRKGLAASSPYWFARLYMSDALKAPSAEFQKEMYELSRRNDIPILVVAAFRGAAKSLIFTQCYPLYAVMAQGIHFVLIFSGTQEQAKQHLANIRSTLEQNELLKKDFGPFREMSDQWGRLSIIVPGYDAKIMAVSIEQTVRGLKYKHYRPQLIVADDIEDMSSVATQEGRDKTFRYVQGEIIPLGEPGTKLILAGNLLHPDSAIMRFKRAIEEKRINGVYRAYPLRDADGNITWPERFTPEVLKAEREKYPDDIAWEREMNLRFVSAPDTVVEREWIQYYDKFPDGGYVQRFAMGVDPAISKRQTADYSAIVSCIVINSGEETKLYVYADPFNQRVNFPELAGEVRRRHSILATGMRPVEVFIEDIAYQAALPQYLETMAGMKVKGFKVPLDKRSKFAVLGDLIKRGKILFPRKGCELLIEQLVGLGMELHDDLPDALALIAFAIFPNPYPRLTYPRRLTWAGMKTEPQTAEDIKRLEREEDLKIMKESDERRSRGISF
jgi:hypothetical protein